MENEDYLLSEDLTLDNESIFKKEWLYRNKINLYYAPNGTCKTLICKKLLKKFESESNYETKKYSYLEKLTEGSNLKDFINNLKIKSNWKNIFLKTQSFLKRINDIRNMLPTLKNNYSKFLFFEKNWNQNINAKESLFEVFFELLNNLKKHLVIKKINFSDFLNLCSSKWNNNMMNSFSTSNFSQKNAYKEIEIARKSIEEIVSESENQIKEIEKQIEDNDKYKISQEKKNENKSHFDSQIKKEKSDLEKKINLLIKNLLKFFEKHFSSYFEAFFNELKLKLGYNDLWQNKLEILEFITKYSYFIYTLLSINISSGNKFIVEISNVNTKKIKFFVDAVLKEIKKNAKEETIKKLEDKFSDLFFNYINFSKVKTIDSIFFDIELSVNIFYKNKLIEDLNNLSDGEKNAILLTDFYLQINTLETNKNVLILLDDSSIAFDKNNWIGLIEMIKDFYKIKNTTILVFSHDSAYINMCEKILSNTFNDCNKKLVLTRSLYLFEKNLIDENFNYFKWDDDETILLNAIHSSFLKGTLSKTFASLLHYNKDNTVKQFCGELEIEFNELVEKYKIKGDINENDCVFSLLEKIIKNNTKQSKEKINFKIYYLFYIRMKIEKFCQENSEDIKNNFDTKEIIRNSQLDDILQEKLIDIYNYLPHYLHIDFFDFSFYFDLSNSRIKFLEDQINKIINDYNKSSNIS